MHAVLLGLALAAAPAMAPTKADEKKGAPVHKITQSESFIMLEPMYATVLDANHPSGLLMVAIGLDIPNEELRGEADHALPVLRDAYIRNLMNFAASSVRPWRQPDVVEIGARLQRVTDRALKRKGAQVLLAQIAIHITK
ncbi:MAG: hypothetical protein HY243_07535 [Proteobacteria bacterium]|nr:hypothetical protein [Pseudomonadota bacterium]